MTAPDTSYDVFISYSHADATWVWEWLRPRLEAAGLRVCLDRRDFDVGVPSLENMERAVDHSRHTLLVLTPAWVDSEWTAFEELLTQTADPAARRRRLLPLLLQPCQPPRRIAMLTYADFTQQEPGMPSSSGSSPPSGGSCTCPSSVRRCVSNHRRAESSAIGRPCWRRSGRSGLPVCSSARWSTRS